MKTFEKLVQNCEQADAVEQQKQRDRATLTDKVNFYRSEINACEGECNRLLKDAEKIVADAKAEAQQKIMLAATVRQNAAKIREKLNKAEAGLRVVEGKPATNPVLVPSVLGLER